MRNIVVTGFYFGDLHGYTIEVSKRKVKNYCKKCGSCQGVENEIENSSEITCDKLIDKFLPEYKKKEGLTA